MDTSNLTPEFFKKLIEQHRSAASQSTRHKGRKANDKASRQALENEFSLMRVRIVFDILTKVVLTSSRHLNRR